jgi:hypothetical protein
VISLEVCQPCCQLCGHSLKPALAAHVDNPCASSTEAVIATEGATKHGASVIRNGTARGLRGCHVRAAHATPTGQNTSNRVWWWDENTLKLKNKKNGD